MKNCDKTLQTVHKIGHYAYIPQVEEVLAQRMKDLKRTTSKLIWQGWSQDTTGNKKMEAALLQNIDDIFKEDLK